jgi:hypothetical protein
VSTPTQLELAELDIDLRMSAMLPVVNDLGDERLEQVMTLMRWAYARGYTDSLDELEGQLKGKLFSDHGYPLP